MQNMFNIDFKLIAIYQPQQFLFSFQFHNSAIYPHSLGQGNCIINICHWHMWNSDTAKAI